MLKQGRHGTLEEFKKKADAVILHLFDDHIFCDPMWCKPLRLQTTADACDDNSLDGEDGDSEISSDDEDDRKLSYYRSKTEHKELFDILTKTYAPYVTLERLMELLHPFDTQLNEALNNVVARYAPKNRTYATTMSLSNRIAIVIGIHNMGHLSYWSEVFERIGLPMTANLYTNLKRLDKQKCWKRKYNRDTNVKQRRVQRRNEKMQTLLKQQIHDNKRGSIYRSGYGVAEELIPKAVKEREQELRDNGKVKCPLFGCHGKTHKSDTSKLCFYYDCGKNNDLLIAKQQIRLQTLYNDLYCHEATE